MPKTGVVANRLPPLSKRLTAPMRSPGASGVKLTFTVHENPSAIVPVHVPPVPSEKSRPLMPCVTTCVAPIVVVAARL
jgi:hypothetical protein